MYFENIEKFNLKNNLSSSNSIFAHKNDQGNEPLEDHMELCLEYFYKIVQAKNLDQVFKNLEKELLGEQEIEGKKLFKELLLNTIYMHDLGKINCNFQYKKLNNPALNNKEGLKFNNSNHSLLSSLIFMNYFYKKIRDNKSLSNNTKNKLIGFMVINSYIISKHHTGLDSFKDFKNKFITIDGEGRRLYNEEMAIFSKIYKEEIEFAEKNNLMKKMLNLAEKQIFSRDEINEEQPIYRFIYTRLMLSLLIACDFYATGDFMKGCKVTNFGEIKEIQKFYDVFKVTEVYKGIRSYEKNSYGSLKDLDKVKDINILRNEMFLDAEAKLAQNINKSIFYLEAPTGSGKSNVALNLSFKLIEEDKLINKIFYVYPFNTLVEQNIKSLEKIFENREEIMTDIAVINSVVPIKERITEEGDEWEKPDYDKSLLDRQFLNYPIVLTTHVSIFNYLFGTTKENLFPLFQMANSVVVLDEIQSYKNSIWKEIIMFLNLYSKALNIKFIIMSATLPDFNKLIEDEKIAVKLIEHRDKYFKHPIFKDRVGLDFSLLEEEVTLEDLRNHVITTGKNNDKNILIEFIKKDTATTFYNSLNDYYSETSENGGCERKILLITGDDNSIDRNKIIEKVKNERNIVLVATQVIEAGVDIDMDIGYKDISMLDSEEQFLGRINRSCRKSDCKVYLFNFDGAASIYKGDFRKEKSVTLASKDMRTVLLDKDFSVFYDQILDRINKSGEKLNDNNFQIFKEDVVGSLDFNRVMERMELIDDNRNEVTVFLSRTIELEDGSKLQGETVWKEYEELLRNNSIDYSQKKVELSKVTAKLNYFIYKVNTRDFTYSDRIGDIYKIDNGESYFTNGKFDRKKFSKGIGEFI